MSENKEIIDEIHNYDKGKERKTAAQSKENN